MREARQLEQSITQTDGKIAIHQTVSSHFKATRLNEHAAIPANFEQLCTPSFRIDQTECKAETNLNTGLQHREETDVTNLNDGSAAVSVSMFIKEA